MGKFVVNIVRANILVSIFIILVLAMGLIARKRYSSKWRYMMWLAAGIFLLFPIPIVSGSAPIQIEITQRSENGGMEGTEDAGALKQRADDPVASGSQAADELMMEGAYRTPDAENAANSRRIVNTQLAVGNMDAVLAALGKIWLAGLLLAGSCRTAAYFCAGQQLRRWAVPQEDPEILRHYRRICQAEGIRKEPKLMCSRRLQSPVLTGIRNVCLYLPDEKYSGEELNLIFHHELIHYKNKDLWYQTFLAAVNTIYWFNPFLYLVRHEAQKDIEYLCDCEVVKNRSKEDCILYSRLLVRTASRKGCIGCASASLNDGTATLKERIVYIMKKNRIKFGMLPAVLCLAALLSVNVLVGCTLSTEKPREKRNAETGNPGKTENLLTDTAAAEIEAQKKELQEMEETLRKEIQDWQEMEKGLTEKHQKEARESVQKEIQELQRKAEELESQKRQLELAGKEIVSAAVLTKNGAYEEEKYYLGESHDAWKRVKIYNVSQISFEFEIYESDAEGERLLFKRQKAMYSGDGKTAVYEGKEETLKFRMVEDERDGSAAVIGFEITGLDPVKGLKFMNNSIPGHEFS